MAPRKPPETKKTLEVPKCPKGKRSRSPQELEQEAKKLFVKGPGSSRRYDSGCLWAGLANLQVLSPYTSIVRALHQHKLGKAAWPMLQQIGAGGSITGLKFNPLNTNQFFTSSMEGTTRLQDFKGNTLRVFTSSGTCNLWFCSLDVSAGSRVVVTGDNAGQVVLLNMDGKELWNLRLHKKKVTHVALNPCCDWLLATASVDQTVKIWDLRQVRGKSSFLSSLPHRHPVNAACFSPDGARLLTTDQNSEIRVYSASQWDCPLGLISHPHRHFQHLTPIKATWHPRYNLIVVGRYPDPNFKSCTPHELRTIDVFDGSSGNMMCQLYDPEYSGIISLNEFNPVGDTLASVMGYHILIWSQEEAGLRKRETITKVCAKQGLGATNGNKSCEKRQLSVKGLKVYKS
ncbi:DNA damage-binding protein 2 isoform X3 [Loxodonta africana]|uniref:DNA damage-binding protein 2 isoform X3 n=1 Tax=Loxodonta africana TaxID=9785 RepID=UPI0005403E1B|nr:DNA damage-binding protein 2 isoform X3 [Loxodonta africana]